MIKNPNDIVDKLVSDYLGVFGADLISAIMYGSAVTHEFRPGKSDINLVFILTDSSISSLARAVSITNKWVRRGVAVPLFMTREYIAQSLDSYPIEFFDIQNSHRVLYGEDVIGSLKIGREHMRLQCERELKGIAIHLRSAFVERAGSSRALRSVLEVSMGKLVPYFRALLVLNDAKIPSAKAEVVSAVEDAYGLGVSVFSDVLHARGRVREDYAGLYGRFAQTIDLIIERIDRMDGRTGGT